MPDKVQTAPASGERESRGVIAAFLTGILCLSFMELFLLVTAKTLPWSIASFFISYAHFLFIPATACAVYIALKSGRSGVVAAACSLVLAYCMVLRFRGLWTWGGTFDYSNFSSRDWMLCSALGSAVGAGMFAVMRGRKPAQLSASADYVVLATLAVLVPVTYLADRAWPADSRFAQTRMFALAAAVIIGLIGFFAFRQREIA